MATNEAMNLNDSELKDAVGGGRQGNHHNKVTMVSDTRGRCCGKIYGGTLYFWPCKKCGRPTHIGSCLQQCDKCDDWFWSISDTPYNGSEEQLKNESAAN